MATPARSPSPAAGASAGSLLAGHRAPSPDLEAQAPLLGSTAPRTATAARARSVSPGPASPASRRAAPLAFATPKLRTPLERVLLGLSVGLFLSCAVFVGLYASSLRNSNGGGPTPPPPGHSIPPGANLPPPSNPPHPPGPVPVPPPTQPADTEFCLSPECVRSASRLLDSMDLTVDPCTDFYQYTCGNWERSHDIPDNKARVGTFDALFDANKRVIQEILASDSPPSVGPLAIPADADAPAAGDLEKELFAKVRSLYGACMDEETIAKRGAAPLRDLAAQFRHTFNGTTSGPIDRAVLADALAKLHDLGVDAFLGVGVESDARDPTTQSVYVSQSGLGLPTKEYYTESRYTDVYRDTIAAVFTYLFDKPGAAAAVSVHTADNHHKVAADKGRHWTFGLGNLELDLFWGRHRKDKDGKKHRKPHHPPGDGDDNEPKIPEDPEHPPRDPSDPSIPEDPSLPNDPTIPPGDGDDEEPQPSRPDKPSPKPVPGHPTWTQLAADIVNLEKALAAISWSSEELSDPVATYNPMSLDQLQKASPALPWKSFLASLAKRNGATLPDSSTVVVVTPSYLEQLDVIIQTTSPATLNGYLTWHAVFSGMGSVDPRTQATLDEFKRVVYGLQPGARPPRPDTCLQATDRTLGLATGRWFVAKKFAGASRASARDMVERIITTFDARLNTYTWLDEQTREKARAKARALDRKIGYPDKLADVGAVVAEYASLRIEDGDHFGNLERATRDAVRHQWGKLGKPTDFTEWGMTPATVNAYYSPTGQEIVFPAGILQPPFYSVDTLDALNHGAIGAVAGHELTHAFDVNGRWYDEKGRLADWWTNATAAEFEKRSKCFIDQYSSFTITDPNGNKVHVNGALTQGENVADNGGLSLAWDAWKAKQSHGDKTDLRLPGLPTVSSEQLFFIGFAHVWCGKARPEYLLNQIRSDPHSPGFVRANAAMQNSPQFACAFSCKTGAPMNPPPEKKCKLW
ncbi:hypothetical protein H9P43_004380 [Blastocladiella emersonii ATCC 22665]|nr:hypothetical protein H9P43_004380 [Blastocladiella emersonii ATCC 22665]